MAMTPTSAAPMPMPALAPADSSEDELAEVVAVFDPLEAAEAPVGALVILPPDEAVLVERPVAVAVNVEVVKSWRKAR
jgi:hypothetical protein